MAEQSPYGSRPPLAHSRDGTLGPSDNNRWHATADTVDMTVPAPAPCPARIAAEPQSVVLDLRRTAIVVVDMQNDFCTEQGWVHQIGGDPTPNRAPVAPLRRLLPALRGAGVPVVWVNWGNRADLANMPPNQIHLYKPKGAGIGLGDPLAGSGAPVLQKDSWAAAIVDELAPLPGDILVDKHRISGFWDTPLDGILRNLGIKTILFAGVNTDQCVLHTLSDANFLGYGCLLVTDCCATTSPAFCAEAAVWNVKKCFGFATDSARVLAALP
jgi:nicotinamidase-related amidase